MRPSPAFSSYMHSKTLMTVNALRKKVFKLDILKYRFQCQKLHLLKQFTQLGISKCHTNLDFGLSKGCAWALQWWPTRCFHTSSCCSIVRELPLLLRHLALWPNLAQFYGSYTAHTSDGVTLGECVRVTMLKAHKLCIRNCHTNGNQANSCRYTLG